MIKVMMTGAGAPGGPGIIKALKQDSNIDLLVVDADPNASGRLLNEKFEKIPLADSPEFIERIIDLCKIYEIQVIFPLVTRELFVFSKEKELFKKHGIKVIVSDYDNLKIANDKSALYVHLQNKNIITPKFVVANTYKDVIKAFKELGYPQIPLCIKPSISNGSRGVRIIDEGINEFELLFNHKPSSLCMSFTQLKKILEQNTFPELLISEVLPGEEYTIDTIVSEGEAKIILPRKRTKMNSGISTAGEFEENQEIINYCKEIISSLNLIGPIGIQVKKSVEGRYKILEINPRIQGTSVAALGAGVNLPLLSVKSILGLKIDQNRILWETKFVRYYEEVFY